MNDIQKKKLTKREKIIYDCIQPKHRRQFIRLSPYKRKRMVDTVICNLERKNYDVSEFKETGRARNVEKKNYYIAKAVRKGLTAETKAPLKTAAAVKGALKKRQQKEVLLDSSGNITREKATRNSKVTASDRYIGADNKKGHLKKGSGVKKTVARQVDKALSSISVKENKKKRTTDEIQREWQSKSTGKGARYAGKAAKKAGNALAKLIMKIVVQLITFIVSIFQMIIAALPLLLPVILIFAVIMLICTFFFGATKEDEEREKENIGSYMVSDSVISYKDDILKELKKYGKEEYIYLFLAVVQQESGGSGTDIFQCSESLGKAAGTLSLEESIKQGVKVLCGHMNHEKVKVASISDLDHIRIALQAYNYGGGYIDYINRTDFGRDTTKDDVANIGKWTQENALAYQKEKSKVGGTPVERTGAAKKLLGPYNYGDAYYTEHVLRYYQTDSAETTAEVKGIPKSDRINFLFPTGLPVTESEARSYMQTITVKIYNEVGTKSSMNITVHKKLVNAYRQAFERMYKIRFPIKVAETAAYCWRNMASDSSKRSYHSYGTCIDINWSSNPATYTSGIYLPEQNPLSITPQVVKIWADAGFFWGGNWNGYYRDYMHFTYTDN